jgi:hypothetical protein
MINNMMKQTVDYLKEVFDPNLYLSEVQKEKIKNLPFYIVNEYTFWKGSLLEKSIVFAKKNTPEHFTPNQYKKQLELLERSFNQPVVFILPDIEAYNRNRLIQKGVNFIISNKQIFIPNLVVDIKEYKIKPQKREHLIPAAQCLILYHLQKEPLNRYNYKQLTDVLKYPYLTITRAVENVRTLKLCKVKGKKEKIISFEIGNKELWDKALIFMTSPVVKKVFVDSEVSTNELLYKSNINALAYYTDINDEKQIHLAIHHDLFRKLQKEKKIRKYSDYEGKYSIEGWKYSPSILANNEYVDPLSLYLEFKENKDERIQLALKNMIEKTIW